ncbi:MAG: hypothetical protein WD054_01485 [Gemmatimonadota bacterium]
MHELISATLLIAGLGDAPAPRPPAPAPQQPPANAWPGSDKFTHFGMSYAVAAFAFAASRSAGADADGSLTIAIPVAVAAGVGKEIMDRRRGGPFSGRDLVADALGVAAAFFLLREVR